MKEMYNYANSGSTLPGTSKWLEVQELAFHDDKGSFDKLSKVVQDAERTSVRLPLIRTAERDRDFGTWSVKQGDTIILDIVSTTSPFQSASSTNISTVPRLHRRPRGGIHIRRTASTLDRFIKP